MNYIRVKLEDRRLKNKNMHNLVSRYNLMFSELATLGQRHMFEHIEHIGTIRFTNTERHSTNLYMNRISVGVIYIGEGYIS